MSNQNDMNSISSYNDFVICSRKAEPVEAQYGSFVVTQDDALPTYCIERVPTGFSEYAAGDEIVINSIPTRAQFWEKMLYFVKYENIIGKVSETDSTI